MVVEPAGDPRPPLGHHERSGGPRFPPAANQRLIKPCGQEFEGEAPGRPPEAATGVCERIRC